MTEFSLLSTVVGGIALALVVAGSLIFLPTILHTETDLKTSALSIEVVNAAHLARSCLGQDRIPESLLESSTGSRICSMCREELQGLCEGRTGLGIKVKDLETPQEWSFGYSGNGGHTAEVFVNILHKTGETTMGRLYAEV